MAVSQRQVMQKMFRCEHIFHNLKKRTNLWKRHAIFPGSPLLKFYLLFPEIFHETRERDFFDIPYGQEEKTTGGSDFLEWNKFNLTYIKVLDLGNFFEIFGNFRSIFKYWGKFLKYPIQFKICLKYCSSKSLKSQKNVQFPKSSPWKLKSRKFSEFS